MTTELADRLDEIAGPDTGGLSEALRENAFHEAADIVEALPAILSALREREVMREALKTARSGINASYALAQAEYHNHDRIAERHDKTVQGAYAAISQALQGCGQ